MMIRLRNVIGMVFSSSARLLQSARFGQRFNDRSSTGKKLLLDAVHFHDHGCQRFQVPCQTVGRVSFSPHSPLSHPPSPSTFTPTLTHSPIQTHCSMLSSNHQSRRPHLPVLTISPISPTSGIVHAAPPVIGRRGHPAIQSFLQYHPLDGKLPSPVEYRQRTHAHTAENCQRGGQVHPGVKHVNTHRCTKRTS